MNIDSYSFGRIVIDGKLYTQDVIVFSDRVFSPWWRKEGHYLHKKDLVEILEPKPAILIIGKGYSGVMKVPDNLIDELKDMEIKVIAEKTTEAVKRFNELKGEKVVAALHLTC